MKQSAWWLALLLLWPLYVGSAASGGAPPPPESTSGPGQLQKELANLLALSEQELTRAPAKSLEYARQAQALAAALEDERAVAKALRLGGTASGNLGSYNTALGLQEQSLKKAQESGDEAGQAAALLEAGIAHRYLGSYDQALDAFLKALTLYDKLKDQHGIADAYHYIGVVNDYLNNYAEALSYHHKALEIRKALGDEAGMADSLNNIGVIYYYQGDYQKTLEYYEQARALWEKLGNRKGAAKILNNIGYTHKELKHPATALDYYQRAIEIWEGNGDKYELANSLNNVGEVYILLQNYTEASAYLVQALKLAREIDAQELIRENYEIFSKLYAAQDDYKAALEYYKLAMELKESILGEKKQQLVADMQARYETEKKQQQIELLTKDNEIQSLALERQALQRNSLLGGLVLVFVLVFVLFNRYRFAKQANDIIRKEKDKSDKLLLNILPLRVANDLKEHGKTDPELFENVTVYFSDIVGFTTVSSGLEPKFLIDELNAIFTAFDAIIERNHCERVKTIGDAYLCVCGMPTPNPRHAENIVRSAIEIVAYMRERNRNSPVKWEIRIGIHSGKVVGGIVGVKKYIYDVFGDTINTASRMESNSEPMKINISDSTYRLVKDQFRITPRGALQVKGKGEMPMYFVEGALDIPPAAGLEHLPG